jgi:phosphohistidine swiveling domain-containing protein
MRTRSWPAVVVALGSAAAASALSMAITVSSAHAEAASTTARLTLTGMVDENCPVDIGGTTAYVAPGGTVTLDASLVGASVRVPLLGTIPLDSRHIAGFADTVTVDGSSHQLSGGGSLVLRGITSETTVAWRATAVTLLPSLLGGITVPLNANNVSLPAGGELDWTGRIIPSTNTRCGVAIALPTVKASVGTHTVTVPGVGVTVSLPGRSHTPTDPAPTSAPAPTGTSSAPSTGAASVPSHGHSPSSGPGKHTGHAPTRGAIDRPALPGPGRHRMPAGRDATKAADQQASAPASGPTASAPGSTSVVPIGAEHRAPAADNQVAAPGTQRLMGGSLPALLAIAAMLALSLVSAVYVRQHLLGDRGR